MRSKALFLLIGLLLALGWPVAADAASCLAGCNQYATGASASTSVSASLTSVGSGHVLHFYYNLQPSTLTVSSVTVTGGSGAVFSATNSSGGGLAGGGSATSGTGSVTLTLNISGTCGNCQLLVEEWPGEATAGQPDGNNVAFAGTSSSLGCGGITTANANDDIELAVYSAQWTAMAATPAGYTLAVNIVASGGWATAYKSMSSTGTYNPTWTTGTGADNWNICAGFLQAGGGSSVFHSRLLLGVGF